MSAAYPPPAGSWEEVDRGYQDKAAVALYKEAGGGKLVVALQAMNQALVSQAKKLEEHHNSPFSDDHARLIATTVNSIKEIELQLERWHHLIYPNQKPKGTCRRGLEHACP